MSEPRSGSDRVNLALHSTIVFKKTLCARVGEYEGGASPPYDMTAELERVPITAC